MLLDTESRDDAARKRRQGDQGSSRLDRLAARRNGSETGSKQTRRREQLDLHVGDGRVGRTDKQALRSE